ncbi:MAG: cupin domain-containing protein [Actinomycetota bacterium]|nr:cupin domain-containing protein [Actinomycetota bacterium]
MRSWDLLEIDAPDGTRDPVVLHSEDARAVLIRLAPGQSLREHEVKERSWITVVDGVVQFEADGESLEGGAGTLAMFDPQERHSVSSAEGARILLLLAPWPGDGHYRGEEKSLL